MRKRPGRGADGRADLPPPGMARRADREIVLHDGQIVAAGHHDQLVTADGIYARLFVAQSQWYR